MNTDMVIWDYTEMIMNVRTLNKINLPEEKSLLKKTLFYP